MVAPRYIVYIRLPTKLLLYVYGWIHNLKSMFARYRKQLVQIKKQVEKDQLEKQLEKQKAQNDKLNNENYNGIMDIDQLCSDPHPCTVGSYLTQTMLRVKDPRVSLPFYTGILGMRLLKRIDFAPMQFTVYFLGYHDLGDIPTSDKKLALWVFSQKATLTLTHNWGTETKDSFEISNGNTKPKGYGHIGICVPDVFAACRRFEELGVPFVKRPDEGRLKGLAFVQDPDGYWVEILNPNNMVELELLAKS